LGDTAICSQPSPEYQPHKKKERRVLKKNLQNVFMETLKLLVNSGENNNAVPIFK